MVDVKTPVKYAIKGFDPIPVAVEQTLFNHSGSYGMGFSFPNSQNGTPLWESRPGEDRNGTTELRLLERNMVLKAGPISEGQTFAFIPTFVEVGKTPYGNMIVAIMGNTIIDGMEFKVTLSPWKYPQGRDRSAHGSDTRNKTAIVNALTEGQMVEVTAAKSSGKLLNVHAGNGRYQSLVAVCPQVISCDGKVVYSLGDHPEVLDDRSNGRPERGSLVSITRHQGRMWARLTEEQMAMITGDTAQAAPEISSLLDEVLA